MGPKNHATAWRTFAAFALALLLTPWAVHPVDGNAAVLPKMAGSLPSPRDSTSAVTLGGQIYVFGGDTGARTGQILRYDPVADALTTLPVALPSPRSGTSAVAAGSVAYLFGGWEAGTYSAQILRFDPSGPSVTAMGAALPSGRTYTSAVWDGAYAYIFGGGITCSPCTTDQIVRYDPATDTVKVMTAKLPMRRYATSAVWDGTHAYIFGGVTASTNTEHRDILRYHPGTDTLTTLPATLPTPRYHTSAAFVDGRAYVYGGFPCTSWPHYCADIVAFDPATGTAGLDGTTLPSGRYLTASTVRGNAAYIIGGYDGARRDDILRHGPSAGPAPGNRAPALDAIADRGVVTGTTLTVAVRATDPDGDPLTLHVTPLSGAASFVDHGGGRGTFTWPTTAADEGIHTVTVRAHDGHAYGARSFRIHIAQNPPPSLDPIADRHALEGTTLTVVVRAVDPANDPLALAVTPMPPGATFHDPGDGVGTFTWAIGYDQAGTWTLAARADDGVQAVTEAFTVTIQNVDRPPVFDPNPPRTVPTGSPLSIVVRAIDPDGDAVTLTAPGRPAGATFTDLGTGQGRLDWTPTTTGGHRITFRAQAAGITTDHPVDVTVLAPYAFTFTALGTAFPKVSPGDTVSLTGRLTNTGFHTDTIQFRAWHTITTERGWLLASPAPVTLARGESQDVTLQVLVPSDGTKSRPRLSATSSGDITVARALTWILEAPVNLTISLPEHVRVRDGSILEIQGAVHATWWNGQPAPGVAIAVQQTPAAIRQLGSARSGATDVGGTFTFDFSLDPTAILPGDHAVLATATRGNLTYHATSSYTVTA